MGTVTKAEVVMRLRHGIRKMAMPKMKAMVEMEIDSIERMTQNEFEDYIYKQTGKSISADRLNVQHTSR